MPGAISRGRGGVAAGVRARRFGIGAWRDDRFATGGVITGFLGRPRSHPLL